MLRRLIILLLVVGCDGVYTSKPSSQSTNCNSDNTINFIFPLRATANFDGYNFYTTNDFVDHNSSTTGVLDYNCEDRTFDVPNGENHEGTDYYLAPFPWNMMQNESVQIVAAADGIILYKHEGFPDTNCGGNTSDMPNWNGVVIQHADSSILYYIHMKSGSVTQKNIDDFVTQGEYLGLVGSSGYSHIPHIHFAFYKETPATPEGVIDPYCGECDNSSYWINQNPYYDSAILNVMTHDSPPEPQQCPQPAVIHEKNIFSPGEEIYIGVYFRDHIYGQESKWNIYDPNGSLYDTWLDIFWGYDLNSIGPEKPDIHNNQQDNIVYWVESWRMYSKFLPTDTLSIGIWRIEIEYEGKNYERQFILDSTSNNEINANEELC